MSMQSVEFAAIWIWEVRSWKPLQQLRSHGLSVTQMAFSPTGSHLISVSRDRSLAVWQRCPGAQAYSPQGMLDPRSDAQFLKLHNRQHYNQNVNTS